MYGPDSAMDGERPTQAEADRQTHLRVMEAQGRECVLTDDHLGPCRDWYDELKDGDPHPSLPGWAKEDGTLTGWRRS